MRRWLLLAASLLISSGAAVYAEDKVTVTATNEDISEGLDLKAVANLFGEVKDLSEFEEKLNSEKLHLSNLDLNGDGQVDYLRVVETEEEKNRHLVLIQAVLAEDIYQDIASIYVEGENGKNVTVQVIGDAYIYGKNYVIEPVYIYRPVIYDWFWGPSWVCYSSPWYWGYWPGWYAPYPCWGYNRYWTHVYVYHYDHPRCSYHYAKAPRVQATTMRNYSSRSDYATANASRSFSARTGASNARELSAARVSSSGRGATSYTGGSRGASSYSGGSGVSSSTSRTSSNYSGNRGTSYSTTISSRGSSSYSGSGHSGSSSYSSGYSSSSSSRGSSSYVSGSSSSNSRSSSYSNGSSSYSGSSRGSSSYSGGGSSYSGGSSGSSRGGSNGGGSYSGGSRR